MVVIGNISEFRISACDSSPERTQDDVSVHASHLFPMLARVCEQACHHPLAYDLVFVGPFDAYGG